MTLNLTFFLKLLLEIILFWIQCHTLGIKISFMNFYLQNNLLFFTILTNFINILDLNTLKKKKIITVNYLIFNNCCKSQESHNVVNLFIKLLCFLKQKQCYQH